MIWLCTRLIERGCEFCVRSGRGNLREQVMVVQLRCAFRQDSAFHMRRDLYDAEGFVRMWSRLL